MTDTAKALYDFFSSFDLPAYVTDNIPDNVQMPYVTYDLVKLAPLATGLLNASVWYRDTSFTAISTKVDQIEAAVGSGISLRAGAGSVILMPTRSSPFCQMRNDPNRETKRAYLSMTIIANTD